METTATERTSSRAEVLATLEITATARTQGIIIAAIKSATAGSTEVVAEAGISPTSLATEGKPATAGITEKSLTNNSSRDASNSRVLEITVKSLCLNCFWF